MNFGTFLSVSLVPQVPVGKARWNQMAAYARSALLQQRYLDLREPEPLIMWNKDVIFLSFPGGSVVKSLLPMQETWVQFLG